MIHLLDYNGLKKLWEKIKSTFVSKPTEELHGGFLLLQEDGSAKWMNLPAVFTLQGRKDSYDDLPNDAENGDVYLVGNAEYYWNGTSWDYLGEAREAQVQADWDEANTDSPAYIKNKPDLQGCNYVLDGTVYKAVLNVGNKVEEDDTIMAKPALIQSYYGTNDKDNSNYSAGQSVVYFLDPANTVILSLLSNGTDSKLLTVGGAGKLQLKGSGLVEGNGNYPSISIDSNITLDVGNGSLIIEDNNYTLELDSVNILFLKNLIKNRYITGLTDKPFTIATTSEGGTYVQLELTSLAIDKLNKLLELSVEQIGLIKTGSEFTELKLYYINNIATSTNISKLEAISFTEDSDTRVSAGADYQLILAGNTIKFSCEDGDVEFSGSDFLKLKELISNLNN